LVFIGLISYSLYLWHWPLIVFQRTDALFFNELSGLTRAALMVAMITMAWLSWRFVEMPFRVRGRVVSRYTVFAATGSATASALALCGLILLVGGAPFRFPERVVAIGSYLAYDPAAAFRSGQCYLGTNRQQLDVENCLKRDPARPNYLLVGDSHAAHLWFGLAQAMPDVNVMQATASACRPAVMPVSRLDTRACPKLMQFVFNDFLVNNKVDKILLSASWKDEDMPGLIDTLEALKARGFDVAVLGPIVEYDGALPRLLVDGILRNRPVAQGMRTSGISERDQAMRQAVMAKGATYLSVYDSVCREGHCDEFAGGDVPLQFDAGHLTAQGSLQVARRLSAAVRTSGGTRHASN
jgi:hypothetical protein